MKKTTYESKFVSLLDPKHFSENRIITDSKERTIEKIINKELLAMRKRDEMRENLFNKLKSTGQN